MSLPDTVDTQSSEWSQEAAAVADAMALATAKTQDLSAFAATQVNPTTPPRSNPKSPSDSEASGEKNRANQAALGSVESTKSVEEALSASTKSKEEALASTKSQEEALSASTKPAESDGTKLTEESMLAARKAYAEHHGLLLENVTPDMVNADAAGAVYWATKNLNLSARGPTAQAMGRAFKHHPEIKEMYQTLLDSEKVRFRQAWAASRSWDFVNFERSTVSSYRRCKEELGVFKTQLQIEVILGGDVPEARRQTLNYINMCLRPDLKAG